MSQVKCQSTYLGKEVDVMAGWDRPLHSYHLTVFDSHPAEDAESDVVWCQLEHFPLFQPTEIGPLMEQLDKMGIAVPTSFWIFAARKEGNVQYIYRDGEWEIGGDW